MSKQLAMSVISAFNNRPAYIAASEVDNMVENLRMAMSANAREENEDFAVNQNQMLSSYGYNGADTGKSFAYVDGMAFIPITGLLINRFNWSWSFLTGYNFIRAQLNAALDDDDVKMIVFDVNSGGGQVFGCFELANDIYASRAIKPSVAVVDAFSYSAAYALASSATKVVVTPSGEVGSIGVVAMHVDYSKMLDDSGIKVSFIYSGDHKIDGNAYQALPDKVRASIQEDVDIARQEFVDLVARNRGLESQAVRDTEADTFRPSEALSMGLIDAVQPPSEAILAFLSEISGSQTNQETTMAKDVTAPGAESAAALTEEQIAAQATKAAQDAAVSARSAERQRIADITGSDEAKDKGALANHLALHTDMSVEQAKEILAAAAPTPVAAAPAAKNPLEAAMEATGGGAGLEPGAESAAAGPTDRVAQILNAQSMATGFKPDVTH